METKIEEMTQADIDRLLKIEKAALAVDEYNNNKNHTALNNALKPVPKPKYKHDDNTPMGTSEAMLRGLTVFRTRVSSVHKDHNHLKLTKLLLDYKDTYCPDCTWKPDQHNWYLRYSCNMWELTSDFNVFNPAVIHMTKKVCEQLIRDIKYGLVYINLPSEVK